VGIFSRSHLRFSDAQQSLSLVIGSCQAAGVLEGVSASLLAGARRSDPLLGLVRATVLAEDGQSQSLLQLKREREAP
jgi:hypothetical protein